VAGDEHVGAQSGRASGFHAEYKESHRYKDLFIKPAYALGQGSLSNAFLCSDGLSQEWDSKLWFISTDYKSTLIFKKHAHRVIITQHTTSCVFNDRCSDYSADVLQG